MEDIYTTRLMLVGTSKGVVIPVQILKALNWKRGDFLILAAQTEDSILIKRITDKQVKELKERKTIIKL